MSVVPPSEGGGGDAAPPPPPPAYPAAPSAYPAAPSGYPPAGAVAPAGWYPPGPAPGLAYAGFGARFLGYLIDVILLFAVESIVTIPFVFLPIVQFYQAHPVVTGQSVPALPADLASRFVVVGLIGAVVSALYFGGLVAWQGRTLGQRAVGAFVVRAEDGEPLPPERAFLRASIFWGPGLLGLIPIVGQAAGLLALIGMLAVAWDPRKQGWHDKLGRSLVVKRVAMR
jgi:uncharacterized RDD family membrane protein YckC